MVVEFGEGVMKVFFMEFVVLTRGFSSSTAGV